MSLKLSDLKKRQSSKEKALDSLIILRERFIATYKTNYDEAGMPDGMCPLCGSKHEDLSVAFSLAEKEIKTGKNELRITIEQLRGRVDELFDGIYKFLKDYFKPFDVMLNQEGILKSVLDIDTTALAGKLTKLDIQLFKQTCDEVSMDEFIHAYHSLMQTLESKKMPVSQLLNADTVQHYKDIHLKYYPSKKINHTEKQIEEKISYIAYCYSQLENKRLAETKLKISTLKEKIISITSSYEEKENILETVISKYTDAQKNYNKRIQSAICIPLYIYSGRIIQNYPLGLGVLAEIKDKKIIFKPENKEKDVYNILSAGQLNGLAISILMAIHSVFGKSSNLNIMMIDDPLQTIDEVSSISFADLMSEQLANGQLFLSTHEGQKSELLQYKFNQGGHFVETINMQREYLNMT